MKANLKIILVLIGIAALSLGEIALMFWFGGKDVKNFCQEIKPGIPIMQLAALAKKHDVRFSLPGVRDDTGAYLTLVNTPRSFGRHTCMVRHDNTAILESQYRYAD